MVNEIYPAVAGRLGIFHQNRKPLAEKSMAVGWVLNLKLHSHDPGWLWTSGPCAFPAKEVISLIVSSKENGMCATLCCQA